MIRTERLELRLPEHADVPEVVRFYVDNRDHLEPWAPVAPPGFLTEEFWHDQVETRRAELREGAGARFFLFALERPQRVIGNVSLTQVARGALQACNLGYSLAADAQGHGYMVEAVRAAVAWAFAEWGLHRVSANYMPRNHRSGRVLRACGFRVEGYSPYYLQIHGRWEDHVNTAIVNPRDL